MIHYTRKYVKKPLGVCRRIIYSVYKRIFEYNTSARYSLIIATSCKQFINRIFFIHRHHFAAFVIKRGMKRNRKSNRQIYLCQPPDIIGKTACGKRNMSITYINSVGMVDKLKEFDGIVKIVKRLAYSHHNDV